MTDYPIFRLSEAAGAVAIYMPAPGGVDPRDINDPMHRPILYPESWLDNLLFHSSLDYMEAAFDPVEVTINHAAIAAASGSDGYSVDSGQVVYDNGLTNHTLFAHNLGYEPDFVIIADGDAIYPGTPVQYFGDGRARYLSAYATSTHLYLEERFSKTNFAIPALTKTYKIEVWRRPPEPSGNVLGHWNKDNLGVLELAYGRWRSDRRYAQTGSNGAPFGLAQGSTIDVSNGAPRFVDPDGTITDIVPVASATAFSGSFQTSGWQFGPSASYNGSFTGEPAIQLRVP